MNSAQDTLHRVGCPIRRSRDQRSLASPPGFSQRATSFIASQCQGIHQMPFFHASLPHPTAKTIGAAFRRNCVPPVGAAKQVSPGQTLLSRRNNRCRRRRHFVRDFARQPKPNNAGPGRGNLPRSHNSLLHNCPSTRPRTALMGTAGGNLVPLPRFPENQSPIGFSE